MLGVSGRSAGNYWIDLIDCCIIVDLCVVYTMLHTSHDAHMTLQILVVVGVVVILIAVVVAITCCLCWYGMSPYSVQYEEWAVNHSQRFRVYCY